MRTKTVATATVAALVACGLQGALPAAASRDAAPPKTLSALCGLPYVKGAVVHFRAGDGADLVGAVAGKGQVGVLFANTSDGGVCDWVSGERQTINAIVGAGDQALLFDYRGTGFSPRHPGASAGAWDRDVLAGIAELRQRGARQVVLLGASTGGIVVLAAATTAKPAVAGIIALSASGDPGPTSTGPAKGGLDAKAAVATLGVPLLFVVAKDDAYAFAPTKTLFEAARSKDKQLLVVPGSAHGLFDNDASSAKVRTRILSFIQSHTKH